MAEPVLLQERKEGIATLTLNRPKAMNALSRELRRAITQAFVELGGDPEVGVVLLTGAGKAFCAGLDLKELGGESGGGEGTRAIEGEADMIRTMRSFDRPILGAVNGFAVTGGFELALACDFLIASTEARFADTHARVGILPGWGLSQLLPRMIGVGRAKELSFTGNYLGAEQALEWGLVNHVVPPDELMPTCRRLAEDILSCDRRSVLGIKHVYDEGYATTLAEGLRLEGRASVEHSRSVSPEDIAGRRAQIQQRGRHQSGS